MGRLHSNPNALDLRNLVEYGAQSELDVSVFGECLEEEKHKEDVQLTVQDAATKAISGTPTFVIGKSTALGVVGTSLMGRTALYSRRSYSDRSRPSQLRLQSVRDKNRAGGLEWPYV